MDKAVALKYSKDVPAPFVVGKTSGIIAGKMIEIAEEYGIPVVKNDILMETLFLLRPGDYIPEEVYSIVAEIFVFIKEMQDNV